MIEILIEQYGPQIVDVLGEAWIWITAGVAALGTWAVVEEYNTKRNESRIQSSVNKAESLSSSGTCTGSGSSNNDDDEKETNKDNSSTNGKRHTPDQEALEKLAKEAEKSGRSNNPIDYDDAKILDEWAKEYGADQHHPAYEGNGEHWQGGNYQDHTHIYNHHIPYKY